MSFNIELIQRTAGDTHQLLLRDFGDTLRDQGYAFVLAPPGFYESLHHTYQTAQAYFAQDQDKKNRDIKADGGITGYVGTSDRYPDKEHYIVRINGQGMSNQSQLPTRLYMDAARYCDLADSIIRLLDEYLGLAAGGCDRTLSVHKLAYYHAPQPDAAPKWQPEHRDFNAITLLPQSTRPALEALVKGVWKPIETPDNHLLLICGKQLALKTAGYMTPIKHRVTNYTGSQGPRYASIFFASWPAAYSLKADPRFVKRMTEKLPEDERKDYISSLPNVTVEEFFWNGVGHLPLPEDKRKIADRVKGEISVVMPYLRKHELFD